MNTQQTMLHMSSHRHMSCQATATCHVKPQPHELTGISQQLLSAVLRRKSLLIQYCLLAEYGSGTPQNHRKRRNKETRKNRVESRPHDRNSSPRGDKTQERQLASLPGKIVRMDAGRARSQSGAWKWGRKERNGTERWGLFYQHTQDKSFSSLHCFGKFEIQTNIKRKETLLVNHQETGKLVSSDSLMGKNLIGLVFPAQCAISQSKRSDCDHETERQKLEAKREKLRRGGAHESSGRIIWGRHQPTAVWPVGSLTCCGGINKDVYASSHWVSRLWQCWRNFELSIFGRGKFPRICQGFNLATRTHSGICSDLFSHCFVSPLCFQEYLLHKQPEKTVRRRFAWLQLLWTLPVSQIIQFCWMALVRQCVSVG